MKGIHFESIGKTSMFRILCIKLILEITGLCRDISEFLPQHSERKTFNR